MEKELLRKKAVEKRKSLDLAQISSQICQKIIYLKEFKGANDIAIFYPRKVEISLLDLLNTENKNFYLPKVLGRDIQFFKYVAGSYLEKGAFGIFEPQENEIPQNIDVIITPALMADKKGYRLGWGGGFYDRYLKKYKGIIICPVPSCQIVDELPIDEYDIKCNFVISENEIFSN